MKVTLAEVSYLNCVAFVAKPTSKSLILIGGAP